MRRSLPPLSATLCVLTLAGIAGSQKPPKDAPLVAPTEARSPDDEKKAFQLPPGFEAQLVASEPDINKPLNMAFDDRGRLWVTSTVEYPFPAKDGLKGRDCVKILEDFGPDGRARKVTTFADGLNIPIGVLPLGDGHVALVHTIAYPKGQILRLTDTDGDGKADKREVLLEGYSFDDTHGMTSAFTLGFDGRVYACHGFRNDDTIKGSDGSQIHMNSGNTYRFRPDGSHVEQWTWGQVNPFGLMFDPLGNLFSADCHSRPLMQLLRGGYYQSFGKPHDGLGFAPEMMTHDHYSTGIAGVCYYAADQFPPEWRDTVFSGNVVTSRINHDKLERHGTTLLAKEQPDFLISDDLWFRPVDFELGPDGALYVADFYNCIIGHYEVDLHHPRRDRERGRIWRIVYRGPDGKGEAKAPRQDWTKATPAELVQDLAHANLTVRMKATHQLAERGVDGAKAVREMLKGQTTPGGGAATPQAGTPAAWQRAHGLWVLQRCGDLDAATLARLAGDGDALVRTHAQKALAERPTWAEGEKAAVLAGLDDADAFVRRAAADALGRHPSAANLPALIACLEKAPKDDTHLVHTVRMAIRDQLRPDVTWKELPQVLHKESEARAVADAALGVPSASAARFLLEHLKGASQVNEETKRYVAHAARYGDAELDGKLLDLIKEKWQSDLPGQVALFREVARGLEQRGAKLSDAGRSAAADLVRRQVKANAPSPQLQAAVELAEALRLAEVQDELAGLAEKGRPSEPAGDNPEPMRTAALKALLTIDAGKNVALAGRVLQNGTQPIGLREQAARLLGQANRPEALNELVQALPTAQARLQTAIALSLGGTSAGGEKLLEAVAAGKASPRLLQDRAVETKLAEAKVPNLKERLAKLTAGLPPTEQRLQELITKRRDGFAGAKADAVAGAALFEKHCAACHQIGNKGAKVGPQLDGIGVRGLDRLLEDILDPNRNVDQAFRTTVLTLNDGKTTSGLLLRKEGEVFVLADNQGKEVRVPAKDVAEQALSQLSPMPSNFAEQVSEADFYNLLAFLLSQRAPAPPK